MAISRSDLKFYLTHIDPLEEQDDPAQSVGGYASDTEAFPSTTITGNTDRASTSLVVSDATVVSGKSYLMLDDEFVKVSGVSGTSVTLGARGEFATVSRVHVGGDRLQAPSPTGLFGNDFSDDLKQYRCLAIRNNNTVNTAYNVSVYLRYASRNPSCSVKLAVEAPTNDARTGTVTSATKLSLTDSSLPTGYADNALVGAVVQFTSGALNGVYALISSYDAATKTAVFSASLASAPAVGVTYILYPGPAQRVINGTVRPSVAAFTATTSSATALGVNVGGSRVHGADLKPRDVVYVWLERTLQRNAEAFDDNRVILAVRYSKS